MLRQEWAKHITERNALQNQAHVEFDTIEQHDLMVKNALEIPAHVAKIQKTHVFLQAWHASQGIVEQISRQQATPHSKTTEQHLDALQRQNEAHPGMVRDRHAVRQIKKCLNAVPEVYGLNVPVERLKPIHSSLQKPPTPDFQIPGEFDVEDLMYSQAEGTLNTQSEGMSLENTSSPESQSRSVSVDVEDEDLMDIDAQPCFPRRPWEAPQGPPPSSIDVWSTSYMIGPYPAHAQPPLWPNGPNIQRSFAHTPTVMAFQQPRPFPPSGTAKQQPTHQQDPQPQALALYQPHLGASKKPPRPPRGPYKKKPKNNDSDGSSGPTTPSLVTGKGGMVYLGAPASAPPSGMVSLGTSNEANDVLEAQRRAELQSQSQAQAEAQAPVQNGTPVMLQGQLRRKALLESQSQTTTVHQGQAPLRNGMQVVLQGHSQSQPLPVHQGQSHSLPHSQAQPSQSQALAPQSQPQLPQSQAPPSHQSHQPIPQTRPRSVSTSLPSITVSDGPPPVPINGTPAPAFKETNIPPYPYPYPYTYTYTYPSTFSSQQAPFAPHEDREGGKKGA
jgi:hypothetical protein